MQKVQTALLQCPQRRYQVAAIHGRNEPGPQRFESARVIPVEPVAVRLRKLGHGGQGPKGLFREFGNGQKAKLAGRLASVQKKAQVGRGHASRHDCGFFLHIVRDQPMMLFRTELGKIPPGPERDSRKKQLVFVGCFTL